MGGIVHNAYIHLSNHDVCCKYVTILFVNYNSIQVLKKKKKASTSRSAFVLSHSSSFHDHYGNISFKSGSKNLQRMQKLREAILKI